MVSRHLALGTGSSTKQSDQKPNLKDMSDVEPRPRLPSKPISGSDDSSATTEPMGRVRQDATVTTQPRPSQDRILIKVEPLKGPDAPVLPRRRLPRVRCDMRPFSGSSNPCFAGSAPVMLASGRYVPVRWLRRGAVVLTPRGPRRVAAVLVTPVRREPMCRVHGLVITPWHPVSPPALGRGASNIRNNNNSSKISTLTRTPQLGWAFPAQVAASGVRYTGCIYSVLLEQDRDPAAHAMLVGGVWAVTLGHGIVAGRDVRAHQFFGHYGAVVEELRRLGVRRGGVVVGHGTRRDPRTGLACGFRRWVGQLPTKAADLKGNHKQS
ncbi:hypothetical protein ACRALDRAFT_2038702 [Sodiomyces alcalophilus JCM 7366]|uniref:uncharacterized protein n=1 Tax=Sodiomyces alcalophilus JCM 7366 TaxID=591952 RepID=UPI0039B4D8C4